ncbi:MAG: hypothetical protein LBE71_02435 [Dysgonamonadaceae bacterium]|jgi:hypothetical protein|nr:hypothetical protein [Dysgonamonadaceae bacterium]
MNFEKEEIKLFLEQISALEKSSNEAIEILKQLKVGLETEAGRMDLENKIVAENEPVGFLGDKISKEIHAGLTKSLTLNQRFMFCRELFKGEEKEMSQTLAYINTLENMESALDYLDKNHPIQWETEAGIAFRELLEKRFA